MHWKSATKRSGEKPCAQATPTPHVLCVLKLFAVLRSGPSCQSTRFLLLKFNFPLPTDYSKSSVHTSVQLSSALSCMGRLNPAQSSHHKRQKGSCCLCIIQSSLQGGSRNTYIHGSCTTGLQPTYTRLSPRQHPACWEAPTDRQAGPDTGVMLGVASRTHSPGLLLVSPDSHKESLQWSTRARNLCLREASFNWQQRLLKNKSF